MWSPGGGGLAEVFYPGPFNGDQLQESSNRRSGRGDCLRSRNAEIAESAGRKKITTRGWFLGGRSTIDETGISADGGFGDVDQEGGA